MRKKFAATIFVIASISLIAELLLIFASANGQLLGTEYIVGPSELLTQSRLLKAVKADLTLAPMTKTRHISSSRIF